MMSMTFYSISRKLLVVFAFWKMAVCKIKLVEHLHKDYVKMSFNSQLYKLELLEIKEMLLYVKH